MLAYSSINHAGFILVGVQAATERGRPGGAVLPGHLHVHGRRHLRRRHARGRARATAHHSLDDYRGLGRSRPVLALLLAVFLFAQAGVPFTSGFFAKFYVITAAVDAGSALAGDRGHAVVGHLGVPVPAHHREPVHGRSRRGGGPAASPSRWPPASPRRVRVRHDPRRRLARARSPRWPGTRSRSSPRSADPGAPTQPMSTRPSPDRNLSDAGVVGRGGGSVVKSTTASCCSPRLVRAARVRSDHAQVPAPERRDTGPPVTAR